MSPHAEDKKSIEERLPAEFRGRSGYRHLLESVDLRISVSGTRGKSKLTLMTASAYRQLGHSVYAKVTGTVPMSYKDGETHPIERDPDQGVRLDETLWEVKRHWPMDVLVLENQAVSPYTMRVFNQTFCRPDYLIITNVRRDHVGEVGDDLKGIAEAYARSAPRESTVLLGEPDPEIFEVVEDELERREVAYVDASPGDDDAAIPAFELVTCLDTLLTSTIGRGFGREQMDRFRQALDDRWSWSPSSLPGVRWFDGFSINDVDSTRAVLHRLLEKESVPVTLVAYFRQDRVGRTASFVSLLEDLFEAGVAKQAYLAGHRADAVAHRLVRHPVEVVPEDPDAVQDLANRLAAECDGEAVMTVGNAVAPWPKTVVQALAGGEPGPFGGPYLPQPDKVPGSPGEIPDPPLDMPLKAYARGKTAAGRADDEENEEEDEDDDRWRWLPYT